MRDIRFRAWNKLCDCKQCVNIPHERLLATRYATGGCFLEDEDLIIEQFTGLHDKNGKEIYEGDIVKARTNHFPRVNLEGVIVFEDAEYLIEQNDGSFPLCSFHAVDRLTIEIIGNIHSNPELLK